MVATAESGRGDRAAEHTELYKKHVEEAVEKAGGARADRKITTKEEAEEAMEYWERRGHAFTYLVTPHLGYDVHTLFTFMAEMAPNTESEIHRHMNEAVIHILEGRGYTMFGVDDERVEWKAGDTLSIPQWAWHQHFNPHDDRVRYLATIDRPLKEALGLWKIEDYEEAEES